jgi:hypothetical protein
MRSVSMSMRNERVKNIQLTALYANRTPVHMTFDNDEKQKPTYDIPAR